LLEAEAQHIQHKQTFFNITAVNHCDDLPKIMEMFKTRMDAFCKDPLVQRGRKLKKSLALCSVAGQIICAGTFILTS